MNFINRLSQRAPIKLVLALPVIFYLAVAIFWHSRHFYEITGDEPHYLLIADSLVRDHDVLVENNYLIETPVQQAVGIKLSAPEHMAVHVRNRFSIHNIGLPLLLTIPYSLAGVSGAKIFLVLLAGFWPLLFYNVLFHITESRLWSAIVALTLTIGLPFSVASNQIYPDLPGGMIVLWVTFKIFEKLRDKSAPSSSWGTNLLVALMIGFLPWLHIRLAAPAILLLLAYAYVTARASSRYPGKILSSLVPAIVVVGSFAALGFYNQMAFANVFGPYEKGSLGNEFKTVAMIVLGLHWDESHGMFMQQPLLLLGLIGIVPLIKNDWRGAILLAMLYFSILLPNAMHPALYGGFSFVGRFGWGAIALWIFPLAFAVKLFLRQNQLVLKLLCIGSLVLQGLFAEKWILHDGFLLQRRLHFWSSRSFYEGTGLLQSLPTFKHFDDYLRHPANYVFVLLGLLLMTSGWLWQRGANRLVFKIWFAFLIVGTGIILLVPPATSSWTIVAARLPSKTGTIEGHSRVATEKDNAEHVIFGPHTSLLAGLYEVMIEYESKGAAGAEVARFDIVYGPQLRAIADVELPPSEANYGTFKYELLVSEEQSLNPLFEFRVKYLGSGYLKVKQVTITPISFMKRQML